MYVVCIGNEIKLSWVIFYPYFIKPVLLRRNNKNDAVLIILYYCGINYLIFFVYIRNFGKIDLFTW